jgi:hypothetical protein
MASLTLRCPHCGGDVVLPAVLVSTDVPNSRAVVEVDKTVAKAHLDACRPTPQVEASPVPSVLEAAVSNADLRGRVDRMLKMGAFIQRGGSRACTMCGTRGDDCLQGLRAGSDDQARSGQARAQGMGTPCCNACGSGDTHPVPKGDLSCAQWAADYHAARMADGAQD